MGNDEKAQLVTTDERLMSGLQLITQSVFDKLTENNKETNKMELETLKENNRADAATQIRQLGAAVVSVVCLFLFAGYCVHAQKEGLAADIVKMGIAAMLAFVAGYNAKRAVR